jgi:hypothetical protein
MKGAFYGWLERIHFCWQVGGLAQPFLDVRVWSEDRASRWREQSSGCPWLLGPKAADRLQTPVWADLEPHHTDFTLVASFEVIPLVCWTFSGLGYLFLYLDELNLQTRKLLSLFLPPVPLLPLAILLSLALSGVQVCFLFGTLICRGLATALDEALSQCWNFVLIFNWDSRKNYKLLFIWLESPYWWYVMCLWFRYCLRAFRLE